MLYSGYHFLGMHLGWWLIWSVFFLWVFGMPYNYIGQKISNDSPIRILQKRFASGKITSEKYLEMKKIIESNSIKKVTTDENNA